MSNYHEYGVNVKVYDSIYVEGQEILDEDDLNFAYESAVQSFWNSLSDYTKKTFNKDCWSEGRSGGWAIFDTGEYEPPEEWVETVIEYLGWAKDDIYPSIVKDIIEDRRWQEHIVFVTSDKETFEIINKKSVVATVETDLLSDKSQEDQIQQKIDDDFEDMALILDGNHIVDFVNIKRRN